MNFLPHSNLKGQHAFLSASKYHWINYTLEKLIASYDNFLAAQYGTILHDFAERCIRLKQKLPRSKKALNMYVNDAIGYRMTPEQLLYYSDNCFGTADTISYDEKEKLLRIHDLKTGVVPAHMDQLEIYTAIFCLEYEVDPSDIKVELRIYQGTEVLCHSPDPERIKQIITTIVKFDKVIDKMKEERQLE